MRYNKIVLLQFERKKREGYDAKFQENTKLNAGWPRFLNLGGAARDFGRGFRPDLTAGTVALG